MGIETYLTVVFCIGILGIVIRGGFMCGEYPRVDERTLGQDVFGMIIAISFFAWVCALKFN